MYDRDFDAFAAVTRIESPIFSIAKKASVLFVVNSAKMSIEKAFPVEDVHLYEPENDLLNQHEGGRG